jgi:hypothetical protein
VQGFGESEAVNTLARIVERRERGRFIRKPEGLDLASGVKNTEIPLRLKSNTTDRCDHSAKRGKNHFERNGIEDKNRILTAFIGKPRVNSWRGLGQTPPHHCQYQTNHWQPKYFMYL